MFGLFGKKSAGDAVEPSANWDAKRRVLTVVDSKGKKTERNNPSAMFAGTYERAHQDIGRDHVSVTLHPNG
jgi:hypothetical protein